MSTRRSAQLADGPLFNLALAPLESCPADSQFHRWYWLTHGDFWIQAGRHQLFRYTPRILRLWKLPADPPWNRHEIAERLRDGVIDQLPAVLQPIPAEMERYVGTLAAHRRFREMHRRWAARRPPRGRDPEHFRAEIGDVSHAALRWTGERTLEMILCRFGHDIEVIRRGDTITLRWFGAGVRHRGIRVWTAPDSGEIHMSVTQYLGEVRSAHKRLLAAMAKRPAQFRRKGLPLDLKEFESGQSEFAAEYETALQNAEHYAPDYPWSQVLAACETIERWAIRRARR